MTEIEWLMCAIVLSAQPFFDNDRVCDLVGYVADERCGWMQEDGSGTVKGKGFKRIPYNKFVTLVNKLALKAHGKTNGAPGRGQLQKSFPARGVQHTPGI